MNILGGLEIVSWGDAENWQVIKVGRTGMGLLSMGRGKGPRARGEEMKGVRGDGISLPP